MITFLLLHMFLSVVCVGGFAGFFQAKEERGETFKPWVHVLVLAIVIVAPIIPIAFFVSNMIGMLSSRIVYKLCKYNWRTHPQTLDDNQ